MAYNSTSWSTSTSSSPSWSTSTSSNVSSSNASSAHLTAWLPRPNILYHLFCNDSANASSDNHIPLHAINHIEKATATSSSFSMFGDGAHPITSLAADTDDARRDVIVLSEWKLIDDIKIISAITICTNDQVNDATNTFNFHIMSYDIASNGDLSNGEIIGESSISEVTNNNVKILEITIDKPLVSANKVIICTAKNTAYTVSSIKDFRAQMSIKYVIN